METYNDVKSRVVGVDISGECTTFAIVDIRGHIIAENRFNTADYPDINDFVGALSTGILELVEANGGYELIRSVGISSPNASFLTGCIENAVNLPWKGVVPLAAMLRDRIGLAVALANDANVAAMGEKVFGAAHGMKNFIVVTLGAGVGSCFYSSGHEHYGYNGLAGELGHICIDPDGRTCGCGHQGCLEAYVGANGIVQTARELMKASDKPSLMRQQEQLTPRIIKELCDQGDEMAIEVFRQTGKWLGLGLANYASLINPETVILTGGISHAGKWLYEPTLDSLNKHVFRNLKGTVKLIISKLDGHERDVLGASALAWEVPEYSLFK